VTNERILDSADSIARIDRDGMGDRIDAFAAQLRAGAAIADKVLGRLDPHRPSRVVLFGMGGSAIAGDLARGIVDREGASPLHVCRHYEPPSWVAPEDFLIFSSYSGETEETLEAYRRMRERAGDALVVTTGGALARLASEDDLPVAKLPVGHPPRAALGYSISTLLHVLSHRGLLSDGPARIEDAAQAVEEVASACGRGVIQSRNSAKQLAIRLVDRAVVVIANERTLGPASLRWKGQLNENSKHLAWASPLPEMNHNEVDGYASPTGLVGAFAAVLLRDSGDHPRVQARFRWLERYLAGRGVQVETVDAPGGDPISRVLGCVALGDWVSYYLALLHGSDPSALPGVTSLKQALSA
jgi:glucose/mannose-6-phosphate isomerase